MSNVLAFPATASPEESADERKAKVLLLLDETRKLVEKGAVDFIMIQGHGPDVELLDSFAGRLSYTVAQGMLACAMRRVQDEMIEFMRGN